MRAPPDILCRLLAAWPDSPETFASLCALVPDWHALLAQAERHGLLGVLHQPLEAAPLPESARRHLDQQRAIEQLWTTSLVAALEQILGCLESRGVPVIPLKGPLLSQRLYGDPRTRYSTDLDFLVLPADLDRALEALAALGYTAEAGPAARYHRRHHHHLGLIRPQSPPVELHFRGISAFGAEIPAAALFARALPFESPAGQRCLIPAAEDEFLYLCVHAAGHAGARLAWLYDIKRFARHHPALDWAMLFSRAESFSLGAAFAFALELLHQRLAVPHPDLPPALRSSTRRWPAAFRLLSWMEGIPSNSSRATLAAVLFQGLLCDRPVTAAWFLQHHLGRILRRRLQRALPGLVPGEWSG